MKKTLSMALALVLTFAMLFTFVGCDDSKEGGNDKGGKKVDPIVGTWEVEVDMADAILESMGELAEFFEIDEFEVTFTFEFEEDGEYKLEIDEKQYKKAFKAIDFETAMTKYLEALIKAEGVEMTVEELLASQGTSIEELVAESYSDETIEDSIDEINKKGFYKVDDDKLYLADDEDDFDDDLYYEIDLDDDKLKIKSYSDEEDTEDTFYGLYPVTFKKN